jgi:hypothetical protein
MVDRETAPRYAAELARIAVFTIAEVRERYGTNSSGGRGERDVPDEKDFEENFSLYLQRIVLESEIHMGGLDVMYKLVIDKVIELNAVEKEIDALEVVRHLTGLVRARKNPDAA